jgi:hypothetical protein
LDAVVSNHRVCSKRKADDGDGEFH